MKIAALPARVAAAPGLARWGRDLTADVLFSVGDAAWILAIHKGVLISASPARLKMVKGVGDAVVLELKIVEAAAQRGAEGVLCDAEHPVLGVRCSSYC